MIIVVMLSVCWLIKCIALPGTSLAIMLSQGWVLNEWMDEQMIEWIHEFTWPEDTDMFTRLLLTTE